MTGSSWSTRRDNEPLVKSSFEEATDAPKADLALTIKDAKDNKATLVINLFGKYCVTHPDQPQGQVIDWKKDRGEGRAANC